MAPDPLIGVYENPSGTEPSVIAISEQALYWRASATVQRVDFSSLRAVHVPDSFEKTSLAELQLELRDGSRTTLHIDGGDGKFRDIYEFIRFFNRVIALFG